ncbi:MAG: peptidoglycan DD-metalloendopeptidase family protein [Chloroflexi bacterium]|nr:peptidoglycan DD-metalloendopeptidase family protein [Chloroflexota bacterium]
MRRSYRVLWRISLLVIAGLCASLIAPVPTSAAMAPFTETPVGGGASLASAGAPRSRAEASEVMGRSGSFPVDDLLSLSRGPKLQEALGAAARRKIITYTLQPGDTLWSVAHKFGLDVDTLRWCNPEIERNPDRIWAGQEILIPPRRGALYTVRPGDTLESIAKAWGVAPVDITAEPLNRLSEPYELVPGQRLFIPNGRKDLTRWLRKPSPAPGYAFAWPLVGRLTQGYSARHRAIDIGSIYGAPVYAALGGVVTHAAWARTGYGYTVIIHHGDGLVTLYSHLKGAWVHEGDRVKRGQLIGEVGSTGRSTGPHVHFEIRVNGKRVNPLDYLPPEP